MQAEGNAGSANAPRVRFAPSPTGYFHVGSARTALYNWLFARQNGGTFILRIEDTDTERNRVEWESGIIDAMAWLGLDWDEGPYRQSQRGDHYRGAITQLIQGDHAYYCDCTREQVEERNQGGKPGYDGFCRNRSLEPGEGRALRFRVDPGDPVVVSDLIRGDVVFERSALEDFVVVKASGDPLFVLANIVDDIEMEITHVIRGEDLLPTTPKGLLIWEALTGSKLPKFAHLPMLVNEKRQKLSKRRDPVAIEQYREDGYLPEVIVSYLSLLGWSPKGDSEVISREELVEQFKIEEVNHSPAFFDVAKLTHFNGDAIRALTHDDFVAMCGSWLANNAEAPEFVKIAPLIQERVSKLSEVPAMVDFLFHDEVEFDPDSWEKAIGRNELAAAILADVLGQLNDCVWDHEVLKDVVTAAGVRVELKLAKAQAPVRVALTGRSVGPPLFESMEILGRDRSIARIARALERVGN